MTQLTHDYEAPAGDGTAITPGNSGGSGRSAFNAGSATAGQIKEVDTAIAKFGAQSGRYGSGATAGQVYDAWNGLGSNVHYGRAYVYQTAGYPIYQAFYAPAAGGVRLAQFGILPEAQNRLFRLLNSSQSVVVTGTKTIPLAAWVRFEWMIDTVTGAWEVRYYEDPDAEVATETLAGTGANFGGAAATEYRLGAPSGQTNLVVTHLDEVEINDEGFPGPFEGGGGTGGGGGGSSANPGLNENATVVIGEKFRLRAEIRETAGVAVNTAYSLQVRRNGAAYEDVLVGSGNVQLSASANFANLDATTDLLPGSGGAFVAGDGMDTTVASGAVALAGGDHTELEWSLILASAVPGDTFDFRVVRSDGTPLQDYIVTPRVTAA